MDIIMRHSNSVKYFRSRQIIPLREKPSNPAQDHVPIFQTGGIGDLIVSLPWLETFKDCPLPVRIYTNYPDITKMFLPYFDVRLTTEGKNNQFSLISSDALDFKFFTVDEANSLPPYIRSIYDYWFSLQKEWGDLIKAHPHKGHLMARKAVEMGLRRWTLPMFFINKPYKKFDWDCEDISKERFITVHDGFSKIARSYDRSTKSWALESWIMLLHKIKTKYKHLKIIQLGNASDKPLPGIDQAFMGESSLSFDQTMRYLKSSLLHLDTDSGLVHARWLLNKPSLVIFGPTNPHYFGYPGNINVAPLACGDCWWTNALWMEHCILGHPTPPKCMQSITPDYVFEEFSKWHNVMT